MGWPAAALLVLSWLTNLQFLPWVTWHAEILSFLAVFLLAWMGVVHHWRKGGFQSIQVPRVALPFALIAGIALFQAATGVMTFWGDAVAVWFYLSLCVACLVLGFNAGADTSSAGVTAGSPSWPAHAIVATAILLGSLASAFIAFAQVFELWQVEWIVRMPALRRPGANLGQPNHLATLSVMGIASAVFLHLWGRLSGPTATLVVAVLCAGVAATESRTGALAVLVLLAWWQFKRPVVARQVSPWIAPALTALFLAMFVAWPRMLNGLLLDSYAANRFGQADVRLAVWSQLVEAIGLRPWVGWGILEVAEAHNAVAHAYPINNPISYSHNIVLDLAVWMGVPVALVLVAITTKWLWRRIEEIDQPATWYCLAIAIPFAVHSLLEFPFAYAYFLVPVLLLAGVLERSAGGTVLFRIGPLPTAVVLASLCAVMAWSVFEYVAIEEDFRIVRFEQLHIGRTPADHHAPGVYIYSQLGALLDGSRIEVRPGMPAADLDALRKLALRYPWTGTQFRYALALALNGQQQEAVRQLQVLRWERGEKLYGRVKAEISEMAQDRYPQLRSLRLP